MPKKKRKISEKKNNKTSKKQVTHRIEKDTNKMQTNKA